MMDCCHSGTIWDVKREGQTPGHVVSISACPESEKSATKGDSGVLSKALSEVMDGMNARIVSVGQLWMDVQDKMKQYNKSQRCKISVSNRDIKKVDDLFQ